LIRELPAGRFRVETRFGLVLKEFELVPTSRDAAFDIDLRNASWAEPRVVLPEDIDLHGEVVRYRVVEANRSQLGSRRILHPGDRVLTFVVDTKLLEPAPGRGRVRTSEGGKFELVARMAPLVRFRWRVPTTRRTLTIQLYRDDQLLRRDMWANRIGDEFCFAAPEPGRYDLVVMHYERGPSGSWAPAVYRDVRIDGATNLGVLRAPERGGRIHVRLKNPPRRAARSLLLKLASPPIAIAGATVAGYPMLAGGGLANSEPTSWTTRNVPRGTIVVRLTAGDREWTQEIECDGQSTRTVEFDCGER
jgi:hypothetical protein